MLTSDNLQLETNQEAQHLYQQMAIILCNTYIDKRVSPSRCEIRHLSFYAENFYQQKRDAMLEFLSVQTGATVDSFQFLMIKTEKPQAILTIERRLINMGQILQIKIMTVLLGRQRFQEQRICRPELPT